MSGEREVSKDAQQRSVTPGDAAPTFTAWQRWGITLPALDEEFPEWTGGPDADYHFQRGWNAHVRALGDNAIRKIREALR